MGKQLGPQRPVQTNADMQKLLLHHARNGGAGRFRLCSFSSLWLVLANPPPRQVRDISSMMQHHTHTMDKTDILLISRQQVCHTDHRTETIKDAPWLPAARLYSAPHTYYTLYMRTVVCAIPVTLMHHQRCCLHTEPLDRGISGTAQP